MIQCERCNRGDPHVHPPSEIGCSECANLKLQIRELCGPYSSVHLALTRWEKMAADLKEKDRLNGEYRKALEAISYQIEYHGNMGDEEILALIKETLSEKREGRS